MIGTNDNKELNTCFAVIEERQMNVEGIPVFSMKLQFSLQTVLYALLKSKSVSTECCTGRCWKSSSIAWTISDLILAAPTFAKTSLESTEQVVGFSDIVKTTSKNGFQKFDNTWCETDGAERCNFTRRFPTFQ